MDITIQYFYINANPAAVSMPALWNRIQEICQKRFISGQSSRSIKKLGVRRTMNMSQDKSNKLKLIAFIVAFVVLLFFVFTLTHNDNIYKSNEQIATLDFIPNTAEAKTITIPATNGLNFKSGQILQCVDLYNPKENNCYFRISIYLSDNTLLWQSNYLKPTEKINEISISQVLQKGTYKNCLMIYDCFAITDESRLNSGEVKIEINVQ